ncbi:MAG TPA: hypothetical protein VN726_03610 [Hanamia sp.]|jgi:hypothetical protein|nr:hypothetical protein [Hanamia sp.]
MQSHRFEIVSNGLPYLVEAVPFQFNNQKRFRITYNGGDENIFAWDSELKRLRAIDEDAATLPDDLEMEISRKLESVSF